MPLYIEDDTTMEMVTRLAQRLGTTPEAAVRVAVGAQLDHELPATPAFDRLEKFWRDNPRPTPTGLSADKAFFDNLSGDL